MMVAVLAMAAFLSAVPVSAAGRWNQTDAACACHSASAHACRLLAPSNHECLVGTTLWREVPTTVGSMRDRVQIRNCRSQTQSRRRLCCHVCMILQHNMICYSTAIYYTDAVGRVAPLFNEELNCMRAWQPDVQAVSHGVPYQPRL